MNGLVYTLLKQRIFWTCEVAFAEDGWYYHVWRNWFLNYTTSVFAGYNRQALNKKSTSFKQVIGLLDMKDY